MAKGRKLTTSRSELFLGNSGYNYQIQGAAANASSELGEEDIWSVADDNTVNGGDDHSVYGDFSSRATTHSNGSYSSYRSRRQPSRADGHQVGGLSYAYDGFSNTSSQTILHQFRPQDGSTESPRGRHVANSAPMNVPDWSKIYRVNSVESLHDTDDDCFNDSDIVPPHEYLAAREYASSRKMAAYSVFEGVGRTLKGRDMSRVRDAVWSQTGFDG